MRRVVFFLVPGLHLLDLAGPAQVFSALSGFGYPVTLHFVAERAEVTSAQGLPLRAEPDWPALSRDDLVIVPGWRIRAELWERRPGPVSAGVGAAGRSGGRVEAEWITPEMSAGALGQLRAHHAAGGTVASVCAGADALGRAGLLDGRRCTTHHEIQRELARRYPRATVVPDVLYVADDRVVTSAGIASGIDLALGIVASWHGPAVAARVAREMVVYARRNGDEPQESVLLRYRAHLSDVVHRVQDLIDARYADPLPLRALADAGGVSDRTLTRLFDRATGLTPLRYQQLLRLERAEHLIGQGSTVESAARTVGFTDARMLRRLRSRPSA
ncbi:GlxA family transcriptional regulator [Cryptosporangium sp. NPDC048952]|uniref:GlxA family transcriptional regulator n=1 Tax=Cryptosporangium sp. NPDC048952 TaxID=3363961 RepID=UPI00372352E3